MPLTTSTPLRLTEQAATALKALQKRTKANKSTLLRLAIAAGLPIVAERFAPPEGAQRAKKRSRR